MTTYSKRDADLAARILKPEYLPPDTVSYLNDYFAVNQPPVPVSNVIGQAYYTRQLDVDGTQQVVQSSVTETPIYTYTLGGGTLGTQGAVELELEGTYLNSSGSSSTFELKIAYGATTMYEHVTTAMASLANRGVCNIRFKLSAADATNSQKVSGEVFFSERANAATAGLGALRSGSDTFPIFGSASEDSTLNKALTVSIQHSVNNASTSYHRNHALLRKIGH